MSISTQKVSTPLLTGAALLLAGSLLAPSAQATVLTFDVQFNGGYGGTASFRTYAPYSIYGDNVSSTSTVSPPHTLHYLQGNGWTPDVTVSYDVGTATGIDITSDDINGTNWGDSIARLAPGGQGSGETDRRYYFSFNPTGGYLAQINSFDLIRYDGSGITGPGAAAQVTADWEIYSGATLNFSGSTVTSVSGTLADSGSVSLGDDTSDIATVNATAGPLTGPVVLVIRDTTGFTGGNRLLALDNLNFDQVLPEPASLALLGLGGLMVLGGRRRKA